MFIIDFSGGSIDFEKRTANTPPNNNPAQQKQFTRFKPGAKFIMDKISPAK